MRLDHKMLPTTDDFLPNFSGNKVSISLTEDSPDLYRIAVWGDDDFGYEVEFKDLGQALHVYNSLPAPLTINWLKANTFKRA